MKRVEINWNPTDRQLRQFGVIWIIALPSVGLVWGASLPVLLVLAVIGVGISVLSQALPRTLKPIFLAMTVVATPIGNCPWRGRAATDLFRSVLSHGPRVPIDRT